MARRGLWVAAVTLVCACGVEAPSGSASEADSQEQALNPMRPHLQPNECRTLGVRPAATGTVRSAPDVGMLAVAPVGSEVQSMYFDTPALGPESRRGVAEFQMPALGGHIVSAHVVFTDQHGWQLQQVPTLTHHVFVYSTADGAVTADDFATEAQPFASISTDLNSTHPDTHVLDATGSVALGHGVGFRIELDPKTIGQGTFGSAFTDFHLEVRLCDEATLPHGSVVGDPSGVR